MEKRIIEGYEIIQSIRVGNVEFVLGVNMAEQSQFVTWKSSPDKPDYCYWGHYKNTLLSATRDLCERALDEVRYQERMEEQRRKHEKKQGPERKAGGKTGEKQKGMER